MSDPTTDLADLAEVAGDGATAPANGDIATAPANGDIATPTAHDDGTTARPAARTPNPADTAAVSTAPQASPRLARWAHYLADLEACAAVKVPLSSHGTLVRVTGLVMEAAGVRAPLGAVCAVHADGDQGEPVLAEVVGFNGDRTFLMATGELHGLSSGARVTPRSAPLAAPQLGRDNPLWRRSEDRGLHLPVGDGLLGRVVDALGVRPDKIVIETPVEASSQPDLLAFVLRNYRSNGFRVAVNVDSVLQWQDIASLVHPHFVKIDSRKLGSGEEARARLAWLHSLREDASVIVTRIEGAAQDYQVGATLRQGHALGRPAASPVGQPQTLRVQPA